MYRCVRGINFEIISTVFDQTLELFRQSDMLCVSFYFTYPFVIIIVRKSTYFGIAQMRSTRYKTEFLKISKWWTRI